MCQAAPPRRGGSISPLPVTRAIEPRLRARRSGPRNRDGEDEGGQGRPKAARRGSLDGPVRPSGKWGSKPDRASYLPSCRCCTGGRLRSALQDQRCWSGIAGLSPGAGHSFATRGGMERVGRSRAGSIKRATSPFGGHDKQRARAPGCVRAWSPHLGQAADLSVA